MSRLLGEGGSGRSLAPTKDSRPKIVAPTTRRGLPILLRRGEGIADKAWVERRKHERLRCHLLCRIQVGRKEHRGAVRNVSDGGLLVEAEMPPPSQGDTLHIALRPERFRPFEVECLAWHIKKGRKPGTVSLGLVLANAPDAFFEYVASLRKAPRFHVPVPNTPKVKPKSTKAQPEAQSKPAAAQPKAEPTPAPVEPTPEPLVQAPAELRRHAVQIKQKSSTRMCRLVVAAATSDAARDLTLHEVGEDWLVVDVRAM